MQAEIRSIHFIGICGTAMAATAYRVSGSDENVYPPMSTFLDRCGINVLAGYQESNLDHTPDLVVVGNVVSRGNPEAERVLAEKRRYCSLPELLKEFFIRGKRSIVVAGTHGKTTTTSLLTWVFEHNGLHPSFLIGGLPENLGQGARFTESDWFIIEGDEYDTAFFDKRSKFVHYLPEIAILNNLEFDHADIFDDLKDVQKSFSRLVRLVPRNGLLLASGDDQNLLSILDVDYCPILKFGLGDENDLQAVELSSGKLFTEFRLGEKRFQLPLFGEFNVRNAMAVIACCRHCGISDEGIQSAFDLFKGIKRRMEVRGEAGGITVIDDFGHHPTAIMETMKAVRQRYPGQRLWAVFEPRSNTTRRNIFQKELAQALATADFSVIAEVARLSRLPEELRLDPEQLLTDIESSGSKGSYLPDVSAIIEHLLADCRAGDVVCIFSNGGFGGIHEKFLARLAGD